MFYLLAKHKTIPDSCVPSLIPDFVGRIEECTAVWKSMNADSSTRIFSIWGSPGFGKTSTAIAIGNQLKSKGESVYYFSFRGVNTMEEFFSKLLPLFRYVPESNRNMSAADEILFAFRSIEIQVFLILDNLDDLLTSSDKKAAVLNFIIDVLSHCSNVFFLTTTREYLEFMSHRVEFDSLRLKPLDAPSSRSLILKFLPSKQPADIINKILRMCGNVPLAMRLLCSIIKSNPGEFLDEICDGSECLLDVLDDPNVSDDARLKQLIQVTFDRLSIVEKEAFVCLSVFDGTGFELDAGIALVGGRKFHAERNIKSLEMKSLIERNGDFGKMYAFHPLIQSFASQKGEEDMKNVLLSSKNRFHEFYIDLFHDINLRFLKGDSTVAYKTFLKEKQRILSSLTSGLDNDLLLKKIVDVLQTCEFFLESQILLRLVSWMEIERLYESALSKVSDFDEDVSGLYTSKQFVVGFRKKEAVLSPEEDEMSRKISLLPLPVQGKFKCYKGIYELSNGGAENAAQLIEDGLLQLCNNPDHVMLKILASQVLSIYYKHSENDVKFLQFYQQGVKTCSINSAFSLLSLIKLPQDNGKAPDHILPGDVPFIIWTIAQIILWTWDFPWSEMIDRMEKILFEESLNSLHATNELDRMIVKTLLWITLKKNV